MRSAMTFDGDLPSGTVTFLFTDVEGSTKLLHELGAEAYAEALAEHRRVIREACARHGGVEVDTQGDAFFFAFPTAPGALAAGGLDRGARVGPIQVRVGLHTGTPLLTDEGYVGGDVHRAARIAAAGHGGQVLVSSATAQLVERELATSASTGSRTSPPRARLPARRRRVPGAQVALPHEPAGARDALPRPRERELAEVVELLGADVACSRSPARAAPGRRGSRCRPPAWRRTPTPTASAGCRSRRSAIPRSCSRRRPDARLEERPRRAHRRQGDALPLRQLRAGRGGRARARRPPRRAPTWTSSSRAGSACASPASRSTRCHRSPRGRRGVSSRAGARGRSGLHPERGGPRALPRLDDLPLALELAAARKRSSAPSSSWSGSSSASTCSRAARDADPSASRRCARRSSGRTTSSQTTSSASSAASRSSRAAARYEAAEEVAEADLDTLQSLVDKSLVRLRDSARPATGCSRRSASTHAERLEESGEAERSHGVTPSTSSRSPRRRSRIRPSARSGSIASSASTTIMRAARRSLASRRHSALALGGALSRLLVHAGPPGGGADATRACAGRRRAPTPLAPRSRRRR